MRAALAGAGLGIELLGVSVLTSADDADLAEAGYALGARALAPRRAAQAEEIGLDGLVASAAEVATLRAEGARLPLVSPGIRPAGAESATRSASRRLAKRSPTARIISSSAARSRGARSARAAEAIIGEIEEAADHLKEA